MEEITVQTSDGITWSCVQAYAGLAGMTGETAATKQAAADGKITLICTPSGGAQTVRLEFSSEQAEKLSDKELAGLIEINSK